MESQSAEDLAGMAFNAVVAIVSEKRSFLSPHLQKRQINESFGDVDFVYKELDHDSQPMSCRVHPSPNR